MTLFNDNVSLLADSFPRKRLRGVTGILDTNNQVMPNPNEGLDVGWTWVRLQGERTAIAVLNVSVTTQRANIPVILEEMDTGQYQIISIDPENALYTYGVFAPAMNMPDRIPEQDKSSIPHKRIKDLRIRLSDAGGLTLTIEGGYFEKIDGDLVYKTIGDIDLTASAVTTADNKRPVIVGITNTGTPVQYAGTEIVTGTAPTEVPYIDYATAATTRNAATGTNLWLWCVPLFYGQASFENTDSFIDLRPILYEPGTLPISQGGTGQTTATAAFNALSPLTGKGDILSNNATDDVRLAVGSTNGMQLIVDSTAATGLAWTAVGNTFQATIQTTGNTITNLVAYTVAELVAVTLAGRIVASKSDKTAAFGASFRVSYRRQTGGNCTLIGTGWLEQEEDSAGAPVITFDADTGTQAGRIRWTGIAAETWDVKVWYQAITY